MDSAWPLMQFNPVTSYSDFFFRGLLNVNMILVKELQMENKGAHTLPRVISPKVNMIVRLEFELVYLDVIVKHFSLYVTWGGDSVSKRVDEHHFISSFTPETIPK